MPTLYICNRNDLLNLLLKKQDQIRHWYWKTNFKFLNFSKKNNLKKWKLKMGFGTWAVTGNYNRELWLNGAKKMGEELLAYIIEKKFI